MTGKHEWQIVCEIAEAMGYPMNYGHAAEIMDEIARLTPTFAGVSFAKLDRLGSIQWPCNEAAPQGTPIARKRAKRLRCLHQPGIRASAAQAPSGGGVRRLGRGPARDIPESCTRQQGACTKWQARNRLLRYVA